MDERKVTCSPTKISSSYLEELRVEDPDFSVSECSENVLLLRKVQELYEKLQKQLEECIRLKSQNDRLKQVQAQRSKQQSSVFEHNDRALFGMFMEKIAHLQEQNRQLKADKENSLSASAFSKQRSEMLSPRTKKPLVPRIPTSPNKFLPLQSSYGDQVPTTRQLLRVASSIDQMWNSSQSPSQSLLYRPK